MLNDDHKRGLAKVYLGYARDNLCIAFHVEPSHREFWFNEAVADMKKAADVLGFDLVPRAAEKPEAAAHPRLAYDAAS